MWAEFEWENKVIVNTNITYVTVGTGALFFKGKLGLKRARTWWCLAASRDLSAYLTHLMSRTNMNCLTPRSALEGDCGFLAANLYARSIFGTAEAGVRPLRRTVFGATDRVQSAGHTQARMRWPTFAWKRCRTARSLATSASAARPRG